MLENLIIERLVNDSSKKIRSVAGTEDLEDCFDVAKKESIIRIKLALAQIQRAAYDLNDYEKNHPDVDAHLEKIQTDIEEFLEYVKNYL